MHIDFGTLDEVICGVLLLFILNTTHIKREAILSSLHYNNLKAQGGATLDVQLIKGLDNETKEKPVKQKKTKKG